MEKGVASGGQYFEYLMFIQLFYKEEKKKSGTDEVAHRIRLCKRMDGCVQEWMNR